jgi:mitochondrial enoyl-[acyl-carrier protein] reductase / trans-2-enoyl-CoA reductase
MLKLLPTFARSRLLQNVISRTNKLFYHEVSFTCNGEPSEVLHYQRLESVHETNDMSTELSQVRVEMIAAPWNPADLNTVQGKYPSPYQNLSDKVHSSQSKHFPGCTVAGSEGWGRVTDIVQNGVQNNPFHVQPGDLVAIGLPGLGTMRSSMWLPTQSVIPLHRGKELYDFSLENMNGAPAVSTLFQLGGTALRILRDFESLEDGDIVIQNAGNSGVGFLFSQLAAICEKRIHSISIVRRGSRTKKEYDDMVRHLTNVGKNSVVVAEEDLLEDKEFLRQFQNDLRNLSSRYPKLAVNAVGGESASLLMKLLGAGGTIVTYGGMSKKPVTIGTSHLIFKNVRAVGYWHSRWMVQNSEAKADTRCTMINELVDLLLNGKIVNAPTKAFQLHQINEALHFDKIQSHVSIREKVAFDCTEKI